MKIHVRFISGGSSVVFDITERQVMDLETSRQTGLMFIKLGNINYNIREIMSWWISNESNVKRTPTIEPYQGSRFND